MPHRQPLTTPRAVTLFARRGPRRVVARPCGAAARLLLLCALLLCRCADERPIIEITVDAPPLPLSGLRVRVRRDGIDVAPPQRTGPVTRLFVRLRDATPGPLRVEVSGLRDDGCPVSAGGTDLLIGAARRYAAQISLSGQGAPGCQVVVHLEQLPPGTTLVTSEPPGIACTTGVCVGAFPRDAAVRLRASGSAERPFVGWHGACESAEPTCDIAATVDPIDVYPRFRQGCETGELCIEHPRGAAPALASVFVSSRESVWATSQNSLLQWNGAFAYRHPMGRSARGVLALAPTAAWAPPGRAGKESPLWIVGFSGRIARLQNDAWSLVRDVGLAGPALLAISGSGPEDIWAAGESGEVLHYDGVGWSPVPSGTRRALRSIYAPPGGPVWIVGEGGLVLRGDVRGLAAVAAPFLPGEGATDVWGRSAAEVYLTGDGGSALRSDGARIERLPFTIPGGLRGVRGGPGGALWLLGEGGRILSFDGTALRLVHQAPARLQALGSSDEGNLWFAGELGLLLRYDGERFVSYGGPAEPTATLRTVHARGEARFAAGDGGLVLRSVSGGGWERLAAPTAGNIYAIWGDGARYFFAGEDLLRYEDGRFSVEAAGVEIRGLAGARGDDLWAAGLGGRVWRFDGARWAKVPSGVQDDLFAVHVPASGRPVVVGAGGIVLRWDGARFVPWRAAPYTDLFSAGSSPASPDLVWVGGEDGAVLGLDEGGIRDYLWSPDCRGIFGRQGEILFLSVLPFAARCAPPQPCALPTLRALSLPRLLALHGEDARGGALTLVGEGGLIVATRGGR